MATEITEGHVYRLRNGRHVAAVVAARDEGPDNGYYWALYGRDDFGSEDEPGLELGVDVDLADLTPVGRRIIGSWLRWRTEPIPQEAR